MVSVGQNWNCPYCGHAQVIANNRLRRAWHRQYVDGWEEKYPGIHGDVAAQPLVHIESLVCANQSCRKLSLWVTLARGKHEDDTSKPLMVTQWQLLPPSSAKPQPEYIPEGLRKDYQEACAIRDLSPKASATVIRRCLQGMIRDFCGIKKGRLIDEIRELRERVNQGQAPAGVQPDTVDAIDQVREIGNIGAHMETDINVIIDVDPDEAQILIELVELLFVEWYVARQTRIEGLARIKLIAAEKKEQKQPKAKPQDA